MCALFRNKYRIGSNRCKGHDYASPGKYFITICTEQKIPYFGKIANGKITLSDYGQIAHPLWQEIPNHFPFVDLDEYIIMPDHIHGIIVIKNHPRSYDKPVATVGNPAMDGNPATVGNPVKPLHATVQPLPPPPSQ
ncbi:MAG: hypothetical protein RBR81_11880 [Bacteroidales bacterium]|jgi:hypothetical protein|nr:hypothetical protein [Bacteroidales bacterium]